MTFALWQRFLKVNFHLTDLSTSTKQCSSYWKIPLSSQFFGLILIQCYFGYILFFTSKLLFVVRFFIVYLLLILEIFLYALVFQCAKVEKCNSQLEKANSVFYKFVFFKQGGPKWTKNAVTLLKAEFLQLPKRLRPFSMHLLDNYCITSKTFYLVIINTAFYFMFIFKGQKHN